MAYGEKVKLAPASKAEAQVAVSIEEAPGCPYGYYEVPPCNCAPDSYYGPEWFGGGGIFIGAGPWYIDSTIEKAIAEDTPIAALLRRNTVIYGHEAPRRRK